MKITKKGIDFNYHGDALTWLWPWIRLGYGKFVSALFNWQFESLRDYWQYVGAWNEACRKEKVIGFTENDILLSWAKREFPHNIVILLRNVNVQIKDTTFWKSIDIFARKQLLKDVVVLFFRDIREAQKVFNSIDPEFAETYLFDKGEIITTNNENNFKQEIKKNRGDL